VKRISDAVGGRLAGSSKRKAWVTPGLVGIETTLPPEAVGPASVAAVQADDKPRIKPAKMTGNRMAPVNPSEVKVPLTVQGC
jgi:hypothetical protein